MTAPATIERPRRLQRHVFAPDVAETARQLQRLDDWHGILAVLEDAAVVAMAIALTARAPAGLIRWATYGLVALPIIATRQRAAATLLHEAAHGTLARGRRLNRILGTYASGYLILQTVGAYRHSHVLGHHGHFGDQERDPDLRDHIAAGLYDTNVDPTTRLRRSFVSPWTAARRLIVDRLVAPGDRTEVMAALAWSALIAIPVVTRYGAIPLIAFWYLPLLLVFPTLNWCIELLEHYPLIATATIDIDSSRHRAVGRLSRHLIGIHNEGYHLDHHLSPRVPFWNLPALHEARLTDEAYRASITAQRGDASIWQQIVGLWTDPAPLMRPERQGQVHHADQG